jgi:hypothetical protein
VSIRNLCLLGLSVTVVQTCAAADVCCTGFPVDCRCRARNILRPVSEASVVLAAGCCSVMTVGRTVVGAAVSGAGGEVSGAAGPVSEAVVTVLWG